MTTDILEINNFIVLIEQSNAQTIIEEECALDKQVIGFSFYGSGDVELSINYNNKTDIINNSSGLATSFYGNKKVSFNHKISPNEPLQSVTIFSTLDNLYKLSYPERELYTKHLEVIVNPQNDYVLGPYFYMTPPMQMAVSKIFNTTYTGITKKLFLQSQITELLAHFFANIQKKSRPKLRKSEIGKLYKAKKIMDNNMAVPPTLSELSKMIGLNNNKLKKNFKELFGVPVFKYLQNERLAKAYELLLIKEKTVQEIAWFVGYESLSSFSNAFLKKYGQRPSEINS